MSKFWTIMSHTFMTRLKSKAFIITNIIMLILIIGLVNIQSIMDVLGSKEKAEIIVLDTSDVYFSELKTNVEAANENMTLTAYDKSESEGQQAVQDEQYSALLTIDLDENSNPEATYYANNIANEGEQQIINDQLQQIKVGFAMEAADIDADILNSIYEPLSFDAVSLDEQAKTGEELNRARVIVMIMVIAMYLVVIVYGTMIINDVATEKSSRVMELIISSVPAVTHLFAKIIGIALLGLTQIGIVILATYGLITIQKEALIGGLLDEIGLLDIPLSLIGFGLLFFLLGYILYATIAAMLGSLVSRTEDAQQLIMPLIFLVMIGYFIAIFGLSTPDIGLVTVSSYIPFFSPMLMLLRIGMLEVPLWEVIISTLILIGTIGILSILAARVYRGGVLMFGSSNSLKDLKRALALSKKE